MLASTIYTSFLFQDLVEPESHVLYRTINKFSDCDGFDTFYIDNKPVCLLWHGKNTFEKAETRCLAKGGNIIQINNERPTSTLLRTYMSEKAELMSFWLRYRQEIWVVSSNGMKKATDLNEWHGIICMKKPINSYRETNGQNAYSSREGWYKATDSNEQSTKQEIKLTVLELYYSIIDSDLNHSSYSKPKIALTTELVKQTRQMFRASLSVVLPKRTSVPKTFTVRIKKCHIFKIL